MESKGIIRRIDELGRIVIPREYRKLHGIELGDPIEICAYADGEIRLKKVDTSGSLVKNSTKTLSLLAQTLDCTVLLTDGKTFVDGYGKKKSEFLGEVVEKWISKTVKDRGKITLKEGESKLCGEGEIVLVNSIHSNGELYGGLVVIIESSKASAIAVVDFCALNLANNAQRY
ncbi:MAG: hypothetical protein IKC64_05025 [Clostridia bacterium]|nr:hypothetical protein [Clostridia bacterium]